MRKSLKISLLIVSLVLLKTMQAQVSFDRNIAKKSGSDTLELIFAIKQHKPQEICRIQQKIPKDFMLLTQEQISDTSYFDKDVVTVIWTSLPKDSIINFNIKLLAPKNTLGYVYMGDCACFYGGKLVPTVKKYIQKEKVWLIDTLLIPVQDTTLFTQIDSIYADKSTKEKRKNKKKSTLKSPYSFRIQITATKAKQDIKDLNRDVIPPDCIYEEFLDDFYKYSIGTFRTYKEAKQRLQIYQQHKINGYIIAFKEGNRIAIKDASTEEENEIITQ